MDNEPSVEALRLALADLAVADTSDGDSDDEVAALEDAIRRYKKAVRLALARWDGLQL